MVRFDTKKTTMTFNFESLSLYEVGIDLEYIQ
jgi:hypothetical protein